MVGLVGNEVDIRGLPLDDNLRLDLSLFELELSVEVLAGDEGDEGDEDEGDDEGDEGEGEGHDEFSFLGRVAKGGTFPIKEKERFLFFLEPFKNETSFTSIIIFLIKNLINIIYLYIF